jgi:hypothetical protein
MNDIKPLFDDPLSNRVAESLLGLCALNACFPGLGDSGEFPAETFDQHVAVQREEARGRIEALRAARAASRANALALPPDGEDFAETARREEVEFAESSSLKRLKEAS